MASRLRQLVRVRSSGTFSRYGYACALVAFQLLLKGQGRGPAGPHWAVGPDTFVNVPFSELPDPLGRRHPGPAAPRSSASPARFGLHQTPRWGPSDSGEAKLSAGAPRGPGDGKVRRERTDCVFHALPLGRALCSQSSASVQSVQAYQGFSPPQPDPA